MPALPEMTLTRIHKGQIEARLIDAPPGSAVELVKEGRAIAAATLKPVPDNQAQFTIEVSIPPEAINDGETVLGLRLVGQDNPSCHVTLLAGEADPDELSTQVALLRQEMAILRAAFRKHVRSGG